MADNNHKVEIDAAWFAELYRRAKTTACDTCLFRVKHDDMKICQDMIVEERDSLRKIVRKMDGDFSEVVKERDDLKAKLEESEKSIESLDAALCNDNLLLAAAERCIEDIRRRIRAEDVKAARDYADAVTDCEEIIRAYCEKKEAK